MNVEEQVVIRIGSGITRRELPTKQSLSLARRARTRSTWAVCSLYLSTTTMAAFGDLCPKSVSEKSQF
jgi:hypothetical protein